ncbi:hypothetical protein IWQ60_000987 [Tieghemiomyces parasiticus]|uniref:Sulfate transporter n=1 Tax=Tieghemiomyces parasiticus TaxID=78921 RepID=A0A9W8DYQ3_9FUNG|nr:hypothetical protein IWQ60_000987 [Tieghemiomyces parasiticus]
MKAIAAMALAKPLTTHEILGAGIGVGTCVLLLGITRTIRLVIRYTPYPVIKGIQVGTGIKLMTKAADLVKLHPQWGGAQWRWFDNYEWALLSFVLVFALYRHPRFPTALLLFLGGLLLALLRVYAVPPADGPDRIAVPSAGFHYPRPDVPAWSDITTGFVTAGLGQLPLTLLNSGIAVCALAAELFPERSVTIESVTISVGLMNVVGCLFGSIPYCHGSGGLAGQYRFGARTEVSILVLGLFKLVLGVVFGASLVALLKVFPSSILGVLLFMSGAELAMAGRRYSIHLTPPLTPETEADRTRDFCVMVVTAGLLIGFSNDAVGFIGGLVVSWLFHMYPRVFRTLTLVNPTPPATAPDASGSPRLSGPPSYGSTAANSDECEAASPSTDDIATVGAHKPT